MTVVKHKIDIVAGIMPIVILITVKNRGILPPASRAKMKPC